MKDVLETVDVSVDGLIQSNAIKAEAAGIAFALGYPAAYVQDLRHEIAELREELKELEEGDL